MGLSCFNDRVFYMNTLRDQDVELQVSAPNSFVGFYSMTVRATNFTFGNFRFYCSK